MREVSSITVRSQRRTTRGWLPFMKHRSELARQVQYTDTKLKIVSRAQCLDGAARAIFVARTTGYPGESRPEDSSCYRADQQ